MKVLFLLIMISFQSMARNACSDAQRFVKRKYHEIYIEDQDKDLFDLKKLRIRIPKSKAFKDSTHYKYKINKDDEYAEYTIALMPGDQANLYISTDIEAYNPSNIEFPEEYERIFKADDCVYIFHDQGHFGNDFEYIMKVVKVKKNHFQLYDMDDDTVSPTPSYEWKR